MALDTLLKFKKIYEEKKDKKNLEKVKKIISKHYPEYKEKSKN